MDKIEKVMLIDDSMAVNRINESLLLSTGYFDKIQKCTTVKEAIDELMNKQNDVSFQLPNIIFLDLHLPDKNGFDFLEEYLKIKEVVASKFEPLVVILSDNLDFENFSKSKFYKAFGVLEHIKKPMDKEDVLDLLDEHFESFNL